MTTSLCQRAARCASRRAIVASTSFLSKRRIPDSVFVTLILPVSAHKRSVLTAIPSRRAASLAASHFASGYLFMVQSLT